MKLHRIIIYHKLVQHRLNIIFNILDIAITKIFQNLLQQRQMNIIFTIIDIVSTTIFHKLSFLNTIKTC